jgi:hypothetical protein
MSNAMRLDLGLQNLPGCLRDAAVIRRSAAGRALKSEP